MMEPESLISSVYDLQAFNNGENFTHNSRSSIDNEFFQLNPDNFDIEDFFDDNLVELPRYEEEFPLGDLCYSDCNICLDEDLPILKRPCCGFLICSSCLKVYIRLQLAEAHIKINCPSSSCSNYIPRNEILYNLDTNGKDKFYKFLVDANNDPLCKTCPRCSHIHKLNQIKSNDKKNKKKINFVICDNCFLEWCFECQAPSHQDISCKQYRKGDKLLKSWAKNRTAGDTNAQKCPHCKFYIQRTSGCDHMTCTKCSTEFCYKCGEKYRSLKFIGNHHSKLSIFGCKYAYQKNHPVKRKVVRMSIFGAKVLAAPAVVSLALGASVVVAGVGICALPIYGGYRLCKYISAKKRIKQSEPNENYVDEDIEQALSTKRNSIYIYTDGNSFSSMESFDFSKNFENVSDIHNDALLDYYPEVDNKDGFLGSFHHQPTDCDFTDKIGVDTDYSHTMYKEQNKKVALIDQDIKLGSKIHLRDDAIFYDCDNNFNDFDIIQHCREKEDNSREFKRKAKAYKTKYFKSKEKITIYENMKDDFNDNLEPHNIKDFKYPMQCLYSFDDKSNLNSSCTIKSLDNKSIELFNKDKTFVNNFLTENECKFKNLKNNSDVNEVISKQNAIELFNPDENIKNIQDKLNEENKTIGLDSYVLMNNSMINSSHGSTNKNKTGEVKLDLDSLIDSTTSSKLKEVRKQFRNKTVVEYFRQISIDDSFNKHSSLYNEKATNKILDDVVMNKNKIIQDLSNDAGLNKESIKISNDKKYETFIYTDKLIGDCKEQSKTYGLQIPENDNIEKRMLSCLSCFPLQSNYSKMKVEESSIDFSKVSSVDTCDFITYL